MKRLLATYCFLLCAIAARADDARFDLIGPRIDARVTRGEVTLPIAEVPNLQPGDRIWLKAEVPADQENRLLLVVAFLRGTTDEPPDDWFTKIETWDRRAVDGTTVVVPEGAHAALLFIVPATGGDFDTLRSAVRGRPGIFLRANAGLNAASFQQQRIERYLAGMFSISQDDVAVIKDHSAKLARVLALDPNADCFEKSVEDQVSCLTQSREALLLDDGHGSGVAAAISTGASSDFINEASTTPVIGGGNYSTYVGTLIDLIHLVSLLHTAQFQYIPAISFPQGATLNLRLNAAPSFNNPKSVIVVGLPAIQPARLPPLRQPDASRTLCLLEPRPVLPIEGAPLVFATGFAHNLVLHLSGSTAALDIPLTPDAFQGGLIISHTGQPPPPAGDRREAITGSLGKTGGSGNSAISGTIRGYWGFDPFEGPTVSLQSAAGHNWKLSPDTQLIAGEDNQLTVSGEGLSCVQHAALLDQAGRSAEAAIARSASPGDTDSLHISLSMKGMDPGHYNLVLEQFGGFKASLPLTAYAGEVHLQALRVHRGDTAAVLTGRGLRGVATVQMMHQTLTPDTSASDDTSVTLQAREGVVPVGASSAEVILKDGRHIPVAIVEAPARPAVTLVSVEAIPSPSPGELPVRLASRQDIPLNSELTLVVQSKAMFPRTLGLEVGTADGSVHTVLSIQAGTIILQDEHTAVAAFKPSKVFGESAFGELRMRPVAEDGTAGDWRELGTLIRTPQITAVRCSDAGLPTCIVSGVHLFLVQSFASSRTFEGAVEVPIGFDEQDFAVPSPRDRTTLYLRLRDDPYALATISLPSSEQSHANPSELRRSIRDQYLH